MQYGGYNATNDLHFFVVVFYGELLPPIYVGKVYAMYVKTNLGIRVTYTT